MLAIVIRVSLQSYAIGNIVVMCAAVGVWMTASFWSDVVLGMAMLAISGAIQVVRAALHELREKRGGA